MRVKIDAELADVLRVGVLRLGEVREPDDGGDRLWAEVERSSRELTQRHAGRTMGRIEETAEMRRLYRAVGLDPTKTRPSSEALLRRLVKGKGLYRVGPLVDLFNLVSVESQLSLGLYDESKIEGPLVSARLGSPGDGYEGIRRGRINVAGRLCLADAGGPFGSPTADSARTAIEGVAEGALAVFFQPLDGDPTRLESALDRAAALAAEHLSARVEERTVIP
jgi:DNA/RNA-binding domain of Phe-tRNA-synthetase-like protein